MKDEAKREKERQTLHVSIQHAMQQLTTLEKVKFNITKNKRMSFFVK
ncbi:hypothetical protein ACEQPO_07500 [Bacillus sp. SL00103]